MNSNWIEFLAAAGGRVDQGVVADFGDAAGELVAARDGTVVAPLGHLALLDVVGDDARAFLHNQLTSDVNHLETNAAQYAAWCTAKGRMQASFLVYRPGAAELRLLLAAELLAGVQAGLQKYVMRSKVKIAANPAHETIGIAGSGADAALAAAGLPLPGAAMQGAGFAEGMVLRLDDRRFIVVIDRDAAAGYWQRLAGVARAVGVAAWQWLDVAAGIPWIVGATREEFVPQMANFDKIGGVSFHKGCYPGQEVVARAQYLGRVKRHLYRVRSGQPLAAGMSILPPDNPEHPCGMIANAAPEPEGSYVGLAVLQEDFAQAAGLVCVRPGGQPLVVEGLV